MKGTYTAIIVIVCVLALAGIASIIPSQQKVAIIPIDGVIAIGSSPFKTGTDATTIVNWIDEAEKDSQVKAIILEINSPGGTPVASSEIARAVKDSSKPTIAYIREAGASGAYWIASASDYVIANELSITGSVGVLGSYLEFSEFLDKYNITYNRFVGGKYKDLGSPYKEMTYEEKKLYQEIIDKMHAVFIREVKENRNLSTTQIKKISTGQIFLGRDALDLGLIDEIGGMPEVTKHLEQMNITPNYKRYKVEKGLLDMFGSTMINIAPSQGLMLK